MGNRASTVVLLRTPVRAGVSVDLTSPVYQLTVARRLSREWRSALTGTEYLILSFVVDHTIMWGRLAYRFTYKGFKDGTSMSSSGTGLGKTQVWATLKALTDKGVIACTRLQTGTEITIDPEWKPIGLATPRRISKGQRSEIRISDVHSTEPQTFGNPKPLLEDHLEDQVRGSFRPADAAEVIPSGKTLSIPERASKKPEVRVRTRPIRPEQENSTPAPIREKIVMTEQGELFTAGKTIVSAASSIPERQRHSAAQAKLNARRSMTNPVALFATWSEAWAEAYHNVPGVRCLPWGKREAGMVKNALAPHWEKTSPELHDFLDWAVTNWSIIMHDEFRWMTREPAPAVPSIKFIASFRDNFIRAFGKRAIDKALAGLSGHERAIREGMLKEGLTHEQAMFRLAERRARHDLREEIEKGKAEVSHQRRAVQAERSGIQKEQRELERRMALQRNRPTEPPRPVFSGAREISDEELAASVQLVTTMMEVDPEGE